MLKKLMPLGIVLTLALPVAAQDFPPNVANPNDAIKHWSYSDPVFFWRLTSVPEDPFEPDAYFYWPNAVIEGAPAPFFDPVGEDYDGITTAALDEMQAWAVDRKSNALIIVHRGELVLEKYWNDFGPDMLVNGRAITRSVTPTVLGFAIAGGHLSLDDPIGKYLTEWADVPQGEVTVRQLAHNTSGLEVAGMRPVTEVFGNKDLCLAYCGDVVRAALDYDYAGPPGVKFEVAQQNMQLLAAVIERAMGEPIQQILSERIWKKIGASDATFQFDRPGGVARVMCCMRATPRDWTRFGVLMEQDGVWNGEQVLPEGWVETMATPSPVNPNFGIGLWKGSPYVAMRTYFEDDPGVIPMSEPYVDEDVRIMEGGGFRVVYMVPSEDLIIFRHGVGVPNWDGSYLVNTALRSMGR